MSDPPEPRRYALVQLEQAENGYIIRIGVEGVDEWSRTYVVSSFAEADRFIRGAFDLKPPDETPPH